MGKQQRVGPEVVEALKSILVGIVSGIVDHPDEVHVNVVPASFRLLSELHTSPDDVGQVIGRSGYVIDSIRKILSAYGGKHGIKIDLDYVTEKEKAGRRSMNNR